MRLLRRRVRSSGAIRLVPVGVLAAAVAVSAAGASPSPGPGPHDAGTCAGSTVTREYTAEAMTFRLHLDLDGCRWWDGSARNLVIWLSRDDGTGPATRYSMTPCEAGSDVTSDPPTCEVTTSVAHPATEQAVTYQGEATWEWEDGPRRVSFDTRCTTAAGRAGCDTAPPQRSDPNTGG